MLRKIIPVLIIGVIVAVFGCDTVSQFRENPRSIFSDPHYKEHKAKRDAIEQQYVQGDITYAEYVEKTDELDRLYDKEVRDREDIVIQPSQQSTDEVIR